MGQIQKHCWNYIECCGIGYEKLFRGNPPTAEDDYLTTWTTNPEQ
jgi:hypothetical protein